MALRRLAASISSVPPSRIGPCGRCHTTEPVIIGAGPAGLAVAAKLQSAPLRIARSRSVTVDTQRSHSVGLARPSIADPLVARDDLIEYLEATTDSAFALVESKRLAANISGWQVHTTLGCRIHRLHAHAIRAGLGRRTPRAFTRRYRESSPYRGRCWSSAPATLLRKSRWSLPTSARRSTCRSGHHRTLFGVTRWAFRAS